VFRAPEIVNALRDRCTVLARLQGESPQGSVNLIYLTTPHRQIASVLQTAREVDPDIFFLMISFPVVRTMRHRVVH